METISPMSTMRLDSSVAFKNGNPSLTKSSIPLFHAPPASLGFEPSNRARNHCHVSIAVLLRGIGVGLRPRSARNRSVALFAASYEESGLRFVHCAKRPKIRAVGTLTIATILFLRELRLLSMRPFIANLFTTLFSGGVVAFYLYKITRGGGQSRASDLEMEPEN